MTTNKTNNSIAQPLFTSYYGEYLFLIRTTGSFLHATPFVSKLLFHNIMQ